MTTTAALAPSAAAGDLIAMVATAEHLPDDIALLLEAELDEIESREEWHRLDQVMRAEGVGL